ncbi:MAG TPA: SdpI family protein [Clostridia bacterium]|nr:SdpI family protein [Clostridia bacterium]
MKTGNSSTRKDWLLILLILASFGIAIYFYPVLPERVPSHWNIYGEIDGYSSRFFGAFGLPLMNIGMYFMFLIIPNLDPKKSNYKAFEGSYHLIRVVMHIFMIGLQILILAAVMGYGINVSLIVKLSVSMLLILTGNVMGRFKHNYFVGIKTPWTLANEEVWRKTHRMAAFVWVAGGIVCAASSFWNSAASAVLFFVCIMALAFVPVVYSYIEYRMLTREK